MQRQCIQAKHHCHARVPHAGQPNTPGQQYAPNPRLCQIVSSCAVSLQLGSAILCFSRKSDCSWSMKAASPVSPYHSPTKHTLLPLHKASLFDCPTPSKDFTDKQNSPASLSNCQNEREGQSCPAQSCIVAQKDRRFPCNRSAASM